jgi:hypothetical protein
MKIIGSRACLALILALSFMPAAAAPGCREPKDAPILSPPLANVVTGAGRLQFYSAPDPHCPIEGTFIVPGDEVIAYAETDDGWTSVTYFSKRAGSDLSGWVRSNRLKTTGTIAPEQ